MAISMQQVRAALDPDEPRYEQAAQLGHAALPFLRQLIEGDDPALAAKATYLAGMIDGPDVETLLLTAARSNQTLVRVAAAGSARRLRGEPASRVLLSLLDDTDVGVRKVALNSVRGGASNALLERVEALSEPESADSLHTHAVVALQRGKQATEPDEACCEPCANGAARDATHVGVGGGSIQGAAVGAALGSNGASRNGGRADAQLAVPRAGAAHIGQGGGSASGADPALQSPAPTASLGTGGGVLPKPDALNGSGTGGGDLGAASPSKPDQRRR